MKLSRRQFLQKSALLAGGTSLLSQHGAMSLLGNAFASGNYASLTDYKSLVCVFLQGGNDSLNMFIPTGSAGSVPTGYSHDDYLATRGSEMSVPLDATLQSFAVNANGLPYAFNPAMPNMRDLYNQGQSDLAVISNVGALHAPITRQEYEDYIWQSIQTVPVPDSLGSHSHQTEFWQKGVVAGATGSAQLGWGGKMADLLAATNASTDVPLSLSLGGGSAWFESNNINTIPLFLDNSNGLKDFAYLGDVGAYRYQPDRRADWEAILGVPSAGNILEDIYNETMLLADQRIKAVESALASVQNNPALSTPIPGGALAKSLRMVARMIAARESGILNMKRQLFFITHSPGGYDTHSGGRAGHEALLGELDAALHSFYTTMQDLGVANSVTTFTASEFGRSMGSNGNGTDHGWGAYHLVMGGAVSGGQVYGVVPPHRSSNPAQGMLPDLRKTGPDAGRGHILIPTTAMDQYGATLARWMGITPADLLSVFPNLSNFQNHDLGFMA